MTRDDIHACGCLLDKESRVVYSCPTHRADNAELMRVLEALDMIHEHQRWARNIVTTMLERRYPKNGIEQATEG